MRFQGWAVDDEAKNPGREVFLVLKSDTDRVVLKPHRTQRLDVAKHFGVPGYAESGYVATLRTDDIPDGCYHVYIRVLASNSDGYYDLPTKSVCFE